MALEASRFVGSIPEYYDRGLGPHIFSDFARDLARRVSALQPATVLELAAGTGIATRKLRDALPPACTLLASDLNSPMLEVARTKFEPNERVDFHQMDATDLTFDDQTFDAVTCQFGVMFFPDKPRSYTEVHRVLNPGGKYVFNLWEAWAKNPFAQIAFEVVEAYFPDDPPGFYRVPFGYHDVDAITQALQTAGFTHVETEHVALNVAISCPAEFAQGLIFGNPLHEEIVAREGDAEEICTTLAEAIENELGNEMPLQAIIVQATKSA